MRDIHRTRLLFELHELRKRNLVTLLVGHTKLQDVVEGHSIGAFGLQIDLINLIELIPIVDVVATEMNLKRLEHVAHGEAEPSRFDTINVKIDLRHIGLEVTKQLADLRH